MIKKTKTGYRLTGDDANKLTALLLVQHYGKDVVNSVGGPVKKAVQSVLRKGKNR